MRVPPIFLASGVYSAYHEAPYKDAMEKFIRQGKEACPDCDVVIAGHSQGGAIAKVASVELRDVSPYVIIFGQNPAVNSDCELIDWNKHYQFIKSFAWSGLWYMTWSRR